MSLIDERNAKIERETIYRESRRGIAIEIFSKLSDRKYKSLPGNLNYKVAWDDILALASTYGISESELITKGENE